MCLAVPGRVESTYEARGARMGRVEFGGIVREVCLELVPEVGVGDYAIVHAGFALARVDEAAALETLEALRGLDALEGEPDAGDGGSAPRSRPSDGGGSP